LFHLAAEVYGIGGNSDFKERVFFNNTMMNTLLIEEAKKVGTEKILAMGTVAAYPDSAPEPISEANIWNGAPHASEYGYAQSKRSMLAQLETYKSAGGPDFVFAISTNLYGENDNFDTRHGHVLPSLIHKFYNAKVNGSNVTIWGDGTAARDFMHSQDAARALLVLMERGSGPVNIGSGEVTKISDVVEILTKHLGLQGRIIWDSTKPNGRKFCRLNLTRLKSLGFTCEQNMEKGVISTYRWFEENYSNARKS
jgi:GDP-L-fucose synthase